MVKKYFAYLALSAALAVASAPILFAQDGNAQAGKFSSQRVRTISANRSYSPSPIKVTPFTLHGGSQLSIIAANKWNGTAGRLKQSLKSTHSYFSTLFGQIPKFKTTIKLMDEEDFYQATGAPRWTNAMYYKEQIIIPMPADGKVDYTELYRSIKHEFTHAVIHSLSAGKCPGWLDEGLAQWAEGEENPALQPALLGWLEDNRPVPLKLLQGGFTKLDVNMVPAAYAQSLFAANTVIDFHGFTEVRDYFTALRKGYNKHDAFLKGFNMSESEFEKSLGRKLEKWSHGHEH